MIHGIINVYKEKGFTSHDVVAKLRGIVGQKKIGHTGTLDPDATGVLPVCLGKATKLCDLLTDKNKTYEAVLLLGKATDTQDITGEVLEEKSTEALTEEKVREAIEGFIGDYEQIPPMYSALKVNGKKLYELAREGKVIERKARPVKILDIQILEIDLPKVRMEVSCSKGTYIRTLCHDIGEKLGCGGCMESLIRTRVSTFRIEDAKTLDEIEALKQEGKLAELLVPIDAMFPSYPKIMVKDDWKAFAKNGNPLDLKMLKEACGQDEETQVRLYDESGKFIAIYQWKEKKYHIVKMFFNE
nr:tRNA pseudouridine(55) synthase TruB [uncultured Dorea sp.]